MDGACLSLPSTPSVRFIKCIEARLNKNVWFYIAEYLSLVELCALSSVNCEARHTMLQGYTLPSPTFVRSNGMSAWTMTTGVKLGSNVRVKLGSNVGLGVTGGVLTMCMSRAGRLLIGSYNKKLSLWDTSRNWSKLDSYSMNSTMNTMCLLSDGKIAVGTYNMGIQFWDVDADVNESVDGRIMNCKLSLNCNSSVHSLSTDQSDKLFSGHSNGNIYVWNTTTGHCLRVMRGHVDWIYSMAMIQDHLLVSGSDDESIKIWDTDSGECLCTLSEFHCAVSSVCTLNSIGLFASGHWDFRIRIWNHGHSSFDNKRRVPAFVCIKILEGHTNSITKLCQLPDSRLVSGGSDKLIKVWDIESSVCLRTIQLHRGYVWCLMVHPDNKRIISGDEVDPYFYITDVDSPVEIVKIDCKIVEGGDDLSGSESEYTDSADSS